MIRKPPTKTSNITADITKNMHLSMLMSHEFYEGALVA
jgi:hypothetical protein